MTQNSGCMYGACHGILRQIHTSQYDCVHIYTTLTKEKHCIFMHIRNTISYKRWCEGIPALGHVRNIPLANEYCTLHYEITHYISKSAGVLKVPVVHRLFVHLSLCKTYCDNDSWQGVHVHEKHVHSTLAKQEKLERIERNPPH